MTTTPTAPAVLTIHGATRSSVAWTLTDSGAHHSTWGQVHRAERAAQQHGTARLSDQILDESMLIELRRAMEAAR